MSKLGTCRQSRRWVAAAITLGLGATLGLAGCSSNGVQGDSGSQARFVSGDGTALLLPVNERKTAPSISGPLLGGGTLELSSLQGKVVALNVWASWCAPCRAEAPALDQVAKELQSKGVRFVGLNTRDTDASAQGFVRTYDVSYPNIVDTNGKLQLQFRETLPPSAIPSTLLIDNQGRVAGRILGKVDRTQLRTMLTELAAEQS